MAEALKYRARLPYAPAKAPPSIVACDGATSDVFYHGLTLSNAFDKYTSVIINGTRKYYATAQEDNAIFEAFLRCAKAGKVDFGRIIVMRTAANFVAHRRGYQHILRYFLGISGGFGRV